MKGQGGLLLRKLIVILYILAFLGAFVVHAGDILRFGFFSYAWASPFFNVFWTLLTLADLLVVYFLIKRVRLGIWLVLLVMVLDVLVNLIWDSISPNPRNYGLFAQILFLGFVLGSFPFLVSRRASA
ncbi:hypothetical protein [Deinococcus arenicola]|uniref:Oxidoreductase n=1 Tax=Deinococcus arenicola TaxID=2994950 RepID=A0ABU4DLS7_9DEIO|nr:hypothetical protein [Deinococcus sp. ZS9-10]MDV6373386.1 hypothetical protein [Deinococcus sp. ZS9-10]